MSHSYISLTRFILLIACFSLFKTAGKAQGIQFEHTGWADILSKARTENKPVFLDAYTAWCGPCKLMVKNTFSDTAVAAMYNSRFINVKIDMEKGEGPDLAAQYGIDLYPTLLFVNGEGQVLHRAAGYHDPADFIALGERALDPNRNLRALIRRYAAGERTPGLLLDLARAKAAAADPTASQLANDYLKTQSDWSHPENISVIMEFANDPFSSGFKFLINNRPIFDAAYGEKAVESRIESIFNEYLEQRPEMPLGEVQRLFASCYPAKAERLASAYKMTYYRQNADSLRFVEAALNHYAQYPTDDPDELTEMAELLCDHSNDAKTLDVALTWVNKAIRTQDASYRQDVLAKIYQKTGRRKLAEKALQRAAELRAKE